MVTSKLNEAKEGTLFPVLESFYSLQGEGVNTGMAAFFIRLAGCNVHCPWCDTKESWNVKNAQLKDQQQLIEDAVLSGAPNVVITGGEPLLYPLDSLTKSLRSIGLKVWLETSGSAPLSGTFDWICLSPKKIFPPADMDIYQKADELKVVIDSEKDFDWAQECKNKVGPKCALVLQPQWNADERIVSIIMDYIKENPSWRLSLQTHKYLNIR